LISFGETGVSPRRSFTTAAAQNLCLRICGESRFRHATAIAASPITWMLGCSRDSNVTGSIAHHPVWSATPARSAIRPAFWGGMTLATTESDFPRLYIIGYGSSPSRCRPGRVAATGQTWDLPVPVQRASTHARFFDRAGPSRHSRSRARPYCLPPSQQRRHPGYES
jgi:hypothetical protein